MKKTLNFLSTALATIVLSSSLNAATAPTIAVLDVNKIMADSKAAKSLNDQMEKLRTDYEKDVSKKEESLRAEQEKIKEQQPKMKEAELEKRTKAFETKVAELQKSIMSQQNQLSNAAQEALNTVRQNVVDISGEIAKSKGFSYVQPEAGFIYFDPASDITKDVISALDKKLPEVKVVIKEETPAPKS